MRLGKSFLHPHNSCSSVLFSLFSRCGHAGVIAAITNGPAIALSAILAYGTEEQRRRIAPEVLMGRKFIALAISEPNAGSDVAGLMTTAKKEGDNYILNFNKKWITNGTYSDYFVVAVRTGKPGGRGHKDLSLLIVDRDTPGFTTRKIGIRGSDVSGTAYLDFNNSPVPVSNLIGKEGDGFKLTTFNFNHERIYVVTAALRLSRGNI